MGFRRRRGLLSRLAVIVSSRPKALSWTMSPSIGESSLMGFGYVAFGSTSCTSPAIRSTALKATAQILLERSPSAGVDEPLDEDP
jgi:hypothetical protein